MQRVACLFSGGKDSAASLFWAIFSGFDPILVTVVPEPYSMMFHHQNAKWTELQSEACKIPQIFVEPKKGEDDLQITKEILSELNVDGIVAGALESEYQRERIEKIGEELRLVTYRPLWHKSEKTYEDVINEFEIYVTGVSAEGLGPELLGTRFSKMQKPNIHPFFEGGEGETFVCDAPFFEKKIVVDEWKKEWDGVRGTAEIAKAHLEEKQYKQ